MDQGQTGRQNQLRPLSKNWHHSGTAGPGGQQSSLRIAWKRVKEGKKFVRDENGARLVRACQKCIGLWPILATAAALAFFKGQISHDCFEIGQIDSS